MIARVHIFLPFAFTVPTDEQFTIYEYEIEKYHIKFYPPVRSELAESYTKAEKININGVPAINVDVLRFDFNADNFERTVDSDDPPIKLIEDIVNNFLVRLRYVTKASNIKPIDLNFLSWDIKYLNDDESELLMREGLFRGRATKHFNIFYVPINNEIWTNSHSIDPNYTIPVWDTLLLDALAILPEVGPSITLTFTALEVCISKILDDIAKNGKVNNEIWTWINNRGFFLKDPSIDEKYDFLSKHLIGKSLKQNKKLWSSFKNLQKARNSFAHNGIAVIDNEIVTKEKASTLIAEAKKIIDFIKAELPEEYRWLEFKYEIKSEFTTTLSLTKNTND